MKQQVHSLIIFTLLAFPTLNFAKDKNFGTAVTLKKSKSVFIAEYHKGPDYDTRPFLKTVQVRVTAPYQVEFAIQPVDLTVGSFIGVSLYDSSDKVNAPIKDLSKTGTDEEVEASSFIQFKAYKGIGDTILLAPVVLKKGYRGIVNKKEFFLDPFDSAMPITNEKGEVTGGDSSLFTRMIITVAGKGAFHTDNTNTFIAPDKEGTYRFTLHMNKTLKTTDWLFVVAMAKIAILPSERGLRSPIQTTPLSLLKG